MTRESGRESRDVEADESHDGRRHQNIIDAGARLGGNAAHRRGKADGRERQREREKARRPNFICSERKRDAITIGDCAVLVCGEPVAQRLHEQRQRRFGGGSERGGPCNCQHKRI